MHNKKIRSVLLALVWLALNIVFLLEIQTVPFHPDETSFLYQSRDFELLLTDPLALGWSDERVGEKDQDYRALNAPLSKYLIGAGRRLGGFGPETVDVDWDWSLTWAENRLKGAIPDPQPLLIGRWSVAILIPAAVVLLYLSGRMLAGNFVGLMSAVLLATNALILLHTRRAMTEGPLIFGISLAILGYLRAHRDPWLAGLGAALAISSKYSALAIVPAGFLAVCWSPDDPLPRLRGNWKRLGLFLIVFCLTVVLLHPIMWTSPLRAIPAMINARSELLDRQYNEIRQLAPDFVLDSASRRVVGLLSMVYYADPQFEEVGNYTNDLKTEFDRYQQKPWNSLARGVIWGTITLLLTLVGIIVACIQVVRTRSSPRREFTVLLFMFGCLIGAILVLNPLPFQRYYLPLVPLICIWIPVALLPAWDWVKGKRRSL